MQPKYSPPKITMLGAVAELTLASCVTKKVGSGDNSLDGSITQGSFVRTTEC